MLANDRARNCHALGAPGGLPGAGGRSDDPAAGGPFRSSDRPRLAGASGGPVAHPRGARPRVRARHPRHPDGDHSKAGQPRPCWSWMPCAESPSRPRAVTYGSRVKAFSCSSLPSCWDKRHLRSRADWLAARGEVALLAVLAASLLGLAGHAAAVEPDTGRAMINDAMHLVAAGVWIGGLWPLAVLLRGASTSAGADARPYAVLVARRFSKCALVAMLVLLASGVLNAALFVGDVAGLVGTSYGRWLLIKLVILTPILALAWINRRTLPALSHDGETVGRPAMRRLATFVTIEGVLALGLLVVVAVLVGTPPARHQVPTWPFSFRLSTDALAETPALPLRVLVGSQIAVSGVVIAFCALVRPPCPGSASRRSGRPSGLRSGPRPASVGHRRLSAHVSTPCGAVYGGVHRGRVGTLRRALRGLSRSSRRGRRHGRLSPSSSPRRSPCRPHPAPHRRRPLLVDLRGHSESPACRASAGASARRSVGTS